MHDRRLLVNVVGVLLGWLLLAVQQGKAYMRHEVRRLQDLTTEEVAAVHARLLQRIIHTYDATVQDAQLLPALPQEASISDASAPPVEPEVVPIDPEVEQRLENYVIEFLERRKRSAHEDQIWHYCEAREQFEWYQAFVDLIHEGWFEISINFQVARDDVNCYMFRSREYPHLGQWSRLRRQAFRAFTREAKRCRQQCLDLIAEP